MEALNTFLNALVQAVLPWIGPVVGVVMAGFIARRSAVNKAATAAAESAERKHGPGAGEAKKEHARKLLRKTISGKLTTMHGIDVALERNDFKDIERRASLTPAPPD